MRGNGAEVRAILPAFRTVLHQPEVGLVNERRRLEGLARTFPPQIRGGQPAQLFVDDRQECVDRPIVGHHATRSIVTLFITTGVTGRSCRPVATPPIRCTTSSPSTTSPKTEWRLSRCGVGPSVMKNWLPLVFGPALAIDRMPALVWRSEGWNSSPNW